MNNTTIFRNYIKSQNLYMEEVEEEGGGVYFRLRESFKNGGSYILVVAFNKYQNIIDIQIFGIAHIDNPLKEEALHNLLNELNLYYRFLKFMESKGDVSAQYSLSIEENNLDPAHTLNIIISLIQSVEESYPKFMKLQWS